MSVRLTKNEQDRQMQRDVQQGFEDAFQKFVKEDFPEFLRNPMNYWAKQKVKEELEKLLSEIREK